MLLSLSLSLSLSPVFIMLFSPMHDLSPLSLQCLLCPLFLPCTISLLSLSSVYYALYFSHSLSHSLTHSLSLSPSSWSERPADTWDNGFTSVNVNSASSFTISLIVNVMIRNIFHVCDVDMLISCMCLHAAGAPAAHLTPRALVVHVWHAGSSCGHPTSFSSVKSHL